MEQEIKLDHWRLMMVAVFRGVGIMLSLWKPIIVVDEDDCCLEDKTKGVIGVGGKSTSETDWSQECIVICKCGYHVDGCKIV